MAGWMLIPDKLDADEENVAENRMKRYGVFVMTTVIFFLLEMGDKTQIATAILAARFQDLTAVVAGSTLGMVIANVPVVFFGDALAKRMPIDMIHRITAGIFLVMGAAILFGIAF